MTDTTSESSVINETLESLTTEGIILASSSLVCMALLAVYIGAIRSVKYHREFKHWIANNIFGMAFSVYMIKMMSLNRVITGCVLLVGMFVNDIFWVFGTNVMSTYASSAETPVLLKFPRDLLEKGFLGANSFAWVGLGDIGIPGIFIALLLRLDNSMKKNSKTYFYASFLAYFIGLATSLRVSRYFKFGQPALIYIVPAIICAPLLVARAKGELKELFGYEDYPEHAETEENGEGTIENEEEKKDI